MNQILRAWLRRRPRWFHCGIFLCLLSPVMPLAAAPEPVAGSAASRGSLDELADRFQNTGAPVTRKAQDMLALVNAEADAQRIPDSVAQGLRWTLEHSSAGSGGNLLALLASTRMPVENSAIMEAAHSLDEAGRAAETGQEALRAQTLREAARRSAELIRGAKTTAEIDVFLQDIEHFQKLAEKPVSPRERPDSEPNLSACVTLMQSLRNLILLTPAEDPSAIDKTVAQFLNDASRQPEFAPPASYSQRMHSILAMYVKAADAARDDYAAALLKESPALRFISCPMILPTPPSAFPASLRSPVWRGSLSRPASPRTTSYWILTWR